MTAGGDRTADDLTRLAVLLAADRGHAEDLVQTALVKAYRRWGRIAGDDLYPYVRRVLVTSAASWRRRRVTQEIVDLPAHDRAGPDDTDAVADRQHMADALAELPPRMRAVLRSATPRTSPKQPPPRRSASRSPPVRSQTVRGLARLRTVLAAQRPAVLEEC